MASLATVASEFAHLASALTAAAYIAFTLAERISLLVAHDHLTPYSCYASLWSASLLIPAFAYLGNKHHFLRGTRINGCRFANVYPHRDPVLGLDLLRIMSKAVREHQLLQVWDELFRTVGASYWTNATGKWVFFTKEPENIKAVLSTQFDSWPIGSLRKSTSIETIGPHAIFSVNDSKWQHARAMIRPTFVRNQLADLECTDRHVNNFLARLPRDGSKFDMQELLYMFTMDISTDFMFGYSTNTLTAPTKEALEFTQAFENSLLVSTTRARLGWILSMLPSKKIAESAKITKRFIDHHVSQALAQKRQEERPYIFMNELIKSGASHSMIRDQLLSLILGGRDTSASAMSSLLWVLARRPDVMQKLKDEVSCLNGRKPTWEDLKSLKYLNMVMKEVLRLYAPVAGNVRTCNKDVVLPKGGGSDGQSPVFIPKGTDCRFSFHSLHRREEYFGPDADEFRPERWEALRPAWEYLPFSGGPRICIGQQFALVQMLYLVTRLLQAFDQIQPGDDEPMLQKISTTMAMVNGCWLRLTPACMTDPGL